MDRLPKLREHIHQLARTAVVVIGALGYVIVIGLLTIAGVIGLWHYLF